MSGPHNGYTSDGDRIVTNDADEVVYRRTADGEVAIDQNDTDNPIKY